MALTGALTLAACNGEAERLQGGGGASGRGDLERHDPGASGAVAVGVNTGGTGAAVSVPAAAGAGSALASCEDMLPGCQGETFGSPTACDFQLQETPPNTDEFLVNVAVDRVLVPKETGSGGAGGTTQNWELDRGDAPAHAALVR